MLTFSFSGEEKDSVKKLLTHKLREIMLHEDLEEVSVKQLKKKVEEAVAMDLTPYNKFLDQQMMVILKQMEKPSKIYDYLYLVIKQIGSFEKQFYGSLVSHLPGLVIAY